MANKNWLNKESEILKMQKILTRSWCKKERSQNPEHWKRRADSFYSLYKYLSHFPVHDTPNHELINSLITIPHIAVTAAELYMKGFLISKRKTPNEVKLFLHNLSKLRKECFKISKDERFNNKDLVYFIDVESPLFTLDGGIRYPHIRVGTWGTQTECALNLLKTIIEEEIN